MASNKENTDPFYGIVHGDTDSDDSDELVSDQYGDNIVRSSVNHDNSDRLTVEQNRDDIDSVFESENLEYVTTVFEFLKQDEPIFEWSDNVDKIFCAHAFTQPKAGPTRAESPGEFAIDFFSLFYDDVILNILLKTKENGMI